MPAPNQSRLSLPMFGMDSTTIPSFAELMRWGNELPFAPNVSKNISGLTAWTSASASYVPWAAVGGFSQINITFGKFNDWTDLAIDIDISMSITGAPGIVEVAFRLVPLKDYGVVTPTDFQISRMPFENVGITKTISSTMNVPSIGVDTYFAEVVARRTAGTMNVDSACFGAMRIREVVPSADF